MTYSEAKDYLEECGKRSGIVPGMERMEQLLSLLGNPEKKLSVIHIAGTNGKGSTAAYLANIFCEAGYKTGRFASPAVFGTREMFLITEHRGNGGALPKEIKAVGQPGTRMIGREEYSSLVSGLKDIAIGMENEPCGAPTRFELETAMAFLYFQKEQCDIVILEAGLGGAGDSTNVIRKPLASVITSISYDHQRFLGKTMEEIAGQKAGIIKGDCPVFSYDQDVEGEKSKDIIRKEAGKKHAPLFFADFSRLQEMENAKEDMSGWNRFIYKGKEYETKLLGEHQCRNAALAVEVAQGLSVSGACIQRGIKKTQWPGRFERIAKSPDVILDGAHNPDAARELAKALRKYFPERKPVFVMGLFADKDYKKIISHTVSIPEKTFCVTTHTKRALDAESLCAEIQKQGGCAETCESISGAVKKAVALAGTDGLVMVFGSLSFLKDVRGMFCKTSPAYEGEYTGAGSEGGEDGKTLEEKGISEVKNMALEEKKLELGRVNRLWQLPEFQRLLLELEEKEKNRSYCRHGREHIFAVARLMWIFCMEQQRVEGISKELVYAAAFLHDLGRGSAKKEHAQKSVEIAGRILPLCGYSKVETALVQAAIGMHGRVRKTYGSFAEIHREVSGVLQNDSGREALCGFPKEQLETVQWLSEVLLKADHDSRDCYACDAREGCYWSEERKVTGILG